MATEVDICNTALSHIAHDNFIAAISPPDGSAEADKCATFYPIARDELLEKNAWRFALLRVSLAQLASNPSTQWTYAYALPNNCIRPLACLFYNETDDTNGQSYTIELQADGVTPMVLTNVPTATLKYITLQKDATKYTPGFVSALSYRLASYLAGAIPRDMKLKETLFNASENLRLNAAATDADSEKNDAYGPKYIPGHLRARSSGAIPNSTFFQR